MKKGFLLTLGALSLVFNTVEAVSFRSIYGVVQKTVQTAKSKAITHENSLIQAVAYGTSFTVPIYLCELPNHMPTITLKDAALVGLAALAWKYRREFRSIRKDLARIENKVDTVITQQQEGFSAVQETLTTHEKYHAITQALIRGVDENINNNARNQSIKHEELKRYIKDVVDKRKPVTLSEKMSEIFQRRA